jgi:hypothetical protein
VSVCRVGETRFFPGESGAEEAGYENDGGAGFDEEFAAVEPVDGGTF